MDISIRLFGPAAQVVGGGEIVVRMADASPTCGAVRDRLAELEPRLASLLSQGRLAVNHCFATDDQVVCSSDEVALIAMVSGG